MFKVKKEGDVFPTKRNFADALFQWGKELSSRNRKVLGKTSSLSYRYGLGFVITSRGSNLSKLTDADLVWVKEWNFTENQVVFCGAHEPSDQSFLHAAVYQNRSSAIFTFFINDPKFLNSVETSRCPLTVGEYSNQTFKWVNDMEQKLGYGNILRIGNQGILSFGCTADDAGIALISLQRHS